MTRQFNMSVRAGQGSHTALNTRRKSESTELSVRPDVMQIRGDTRKQFLHAHEETPYIARLILGLTLGHEDRLPQG